MFSEEVRRGEFAFFALCLTVFVGRLEIFTVLVLLTPAFWRPKVASSG